jgi:hypothetical protein
MLIRSLSLCVLLVLPVSAQADDQAAAEPQNNSSTAPDAKDSRVKAVQLKWHDNYGAALNATRKDGRPLLIVLEDTKNKETAIDQSLLADEGEQAELLAKYNLCRVDASTQYGQKVAKVFRATTFPMTAIIDKAGAVILDKQTGKVEGSRFRTRLAEHQTGVRRARSVRTSFFRGSQPNSVISGPQSYPTTSGVPANCPSCQRRALGY